MSRLLDSLEFVEALIPLGRSPDRAARLLFEGELAMATE